jgi:hypothetical protein
MINRKWPGLMIWAILLAGLSAAGVWIAVSHATSQGPARTEVREGMLLPTQEVSGTVQSPAISFIDNPSATCYRPVAGTDACYVTWNYLYVTSTPGQYMISMTMAIDERLRTYIQGFFQTALYIPGDMLGKGLRVACGTPGVDGLAGRGYTYNYVVRAQETGGLKAANYGTVICPADIVSLTDLSLTGPTTGIIARTYNFEASVLPITATLPVTYTWIVTDHPISEIVTGTNTSTAYSWATAGNKAILLTAENLNSSLSDTLMVNIDLYYGIYLPVVRRK